MVSYLCGTITSRASNTVTINVNGIGFEVEMAHTSNLQPNMSAKLITYVHWNQEQGPKLFGFHQEFERTIFELIISCSGIGPKIALAILRDLGPTTFLQAITTHTTDTLSSVSGIGKKKAEQLILQLKEKAANLVTSGVIQGAGAPMLWKDVSEALASLNYSRTEISRVVTTLQAEPHAPEYSFDIVFRKALSLMTKVR